MSDERYAKIPYHRCGASGLMLPAVSLGLWHNFGHNADPAHMEELCLSAFECGITHFDLANNYGPPPGAAEENFGKLLAGPLKAHRDELVISTKAGYDMWAGPYGDGGSRKYLLASLDQSLKRMGLDYVDIFYHHRPDPDTPLEETMEALDFAVRSGKALYVGISNYDGAQTVRAAELLAKKGTPFIINQRSYSLLNRAIETDGLKDQAVRLGIGIIAFSPLAQGLLSDKYLGGIPQDSRVRTDPRFLRESDLTPEKLAMVAALNKVAGQRGQSLSQMALSWVLRDGIVTSVLIGASKVAQIRENVAAAQNIKFSKEELGKIDAILAGEV